MSEEEIFKVSTLSEEELKKLEEEPEVEETRESIVEKLFEGEYVEREYVVIDVQLPRREWNPRKIYLYVLNQNDPLTIDVDNEKFKEIVEALKKFKIVRIKVKQLKIQTMIDGELVEDVSKDIEEVLEVQELDPLEYFKKNEVKHGIVQLRRGKSSPYFKEDGQIKLIVSGYTLNGKRLNDSLSRDKNTNVFLVPSIVTKRNDVTVVQGCWFMLKKKDERKSEEEIEEEVERIVQEVETEVKEEERIGRFKVEEEQ